jgi:hypothetical protein
LTNVAIRESRITPRWLVVLSPFLRKLITEKAETPIVEAAAGVPVA